MWFLYVEWQTRRVPDTHPKSDGYAYGYEFLPAGTCTGTNFYPQALYWPVVIPRGAGGSGMGIERVQRRACGPCPVVSYWAGCIGPAWNEQFCLWFIEILFKRTWINLITRWSYLALKFSNKIWIWSLWNNEELYLL
jgi:hypothetical protein